MRRPLFFIAIAAAQSAGSIGAPLIAARQLGPAELGFLAVGLLVVVLVRAAASLGLYGPISVLLHEGSAGEAHARRLLRWSGLFCLPLAFLTVAAGVLIPTILGTYLMAVGAGFCGAVSLGHQSLHRSIVNNRAYATAALGPTAVSHALAVLYVIADDGGSREYLLVMALGSIVSSLWLHWAFVRASGRPARGELRGALRIGMPLVVTAAATVGLSLGNRPLIQTFLGADASGRYHLAYILAAGGVPLLGALNNTWLPTILSLPSEKRMSSLSVSTAGVARGMAAVAVGSAVAAPAAIGLVGGSAYITADTAALCAAIAFGVLPYAFYSGATIGLLSLRYTSAIGYATSAGLAANLSMNLLLIPTVGVLGAALASVVGYAVAGTVAWVRLTGSISWTSASRSVGPVVIVTLVALLGAAALPLGSTTSDSVRFALGAVVTLGGCGVVARASAARP